MLSDMTLPQILAVSILPILLAITFHEVAHGWVASLFGDQTARLSGRLTLNPIKHIDLVGTIIVPVIMMITMGFMFGWAKPVPVDARNMRNPRWDMIVVAAAGPASNLIMAFIWAGIGKLGLLITINTPGLGQPLFFMGEIGILANVVLAILNLLPVPPLDGGRIFSNLLPPRISWYLSRFEPYIFLFLVILIVTHVISAIIMPPITLLTQWVTALFGMPPIF